MRILTVILTWNKKKEVCRLLEVFPEKIKAIKPDVLVVDNASTDGTSEMIMERFPWVKLITNEENLGGSAGFNVGLKYGIENGYKYVWLLDNDAYPVADALKGLVKAAESDPKIGSVGSCILSAEDPNIVVELGGKILLSKFTITGNCRGTRLKECKEMYEVDYVASCSALYRVEALKEIGLMDEGYFIYYDDVDLGFRLKKAGWKNISVKSSLIIHGTFTEKNLGNAFNRYYYTRNAFFFFYKNYRRDLLIIKGFMRNLALAELQRLLGRGVLVEATIEGIKDFIKGKRGKRELNLREEEISYGPLKERGIKVLFSYGTPFTEVKEKINLLKEYKAEKFYVLLTQDRVELFKKIENLEIFVLRKNIFHLFYIVIKMIIGEKIKYVYTQEKGNITSLLFKYNLFERNGTFYVKKNNRVFNIVKIVLIFPMDMIYKLLKYTIMYLKAKKDKTLMA